MLFKLILVLCVIQTCLSRCDECNNDYTRIKRAKYYSNPPPRFYRKPPMSYPIRGPFSYTPPPGYMDDGDKNSGPPAPYKVSKPKEGLGDEDFQNLIKYLSKQDLDRIVELAGEKLRHTERFPSPNEQKNMFKNSELDFDPSKLIPFTNDDHKPSNIEYSNPPNYVQIRPGSSPDNNQVNPYLEPEESKQISYLNGHIQKELNKVEYQQVAQKGRDDVIFTDSESMKEEQLPRPQNLREEIDYEASYTNNVPSIVQAQSYKLENFADLPLMNYDHSKLETVNSYSVPHYTVTSSRNQESLAVPPPSFHVNTNVQTNQVAQQSDAHLKAIKIWTHKSTGTAYTLHDDGTLSLERPLPKRPF
ncbi:unnamed protein product [Colias eurytheme]|nr:unnamed protein product [Colias eurytheme]